MRWPRDRTLTVDIAVAVCLCAFWLWFSWQYGFRNTPDSWYRGILASSIGEGHPFEVSIKQSYLYEFGPRLHPDAQHAPLIPLLMAACFAAFGKRIVFANLISCLSAGLLYLPLARLSRSLCRTALPGALAYLFPVFIEGSSFLFETLGGLSIPTATLLLLSSLHFYRRMWETGRLREAVIGGGLLGTAALTRTDAQYAGFAWLAVNALIAAVAWRRADKAALARIAVFATTHVLVLSPWLLRNALVFGNPVFSHPSLAAWTSSGSELYEYHEDRPLPSAARYFSEHSLLDFAAKVATGLRAAYRIGSKDVLPLAFWLPAFVLALAWLLHGAARDASPGRARWLTLLAIPSLCAGYALTFSLAADAFLDDRFLIPLLFLMALTCFAAVVGVARAAARRWAPTHGRTVVAAALALLAALTVHAQSGFWRGGFRRYLLRAYTGQDALAARDPVIAALRALPRDAVVLTPFSQTQRIGFLTGRTVIEEPVNLTELKRPLEFLRRYGVSHSLVDVTAVLPARHIAAVQLLGDAALYELDLDAAPPTENTAVATREDARALAVHRAKANKAILLDSAHGGYDPQFRELLVALGYRVTVSAGSLASEDGALPESGLLALSYRMHGAPLEAAEWARIVSFVDSGGSVLLMCPAWVWLDYEHRRLDESPFNRIGALFGTYVVGEYPSGRLRMPATPLAAVHGLESEDWWGSFSKVVSTNPRTLPLFEDSERSAFARAAVRGRSRAVVVGHNFMARRETYDRDPRLVAVLRSWLDWLLDSSAVAP